MKGKKRTIAGKLNDSRKVRSDLLLIYRECYSYRRLPSRLILPFPVTHGILVSYDLTTCSRVTFHKPVHSVRDISEVAEQGAHMAGFCIAGEGRTLPNRIDQIPGMHIVSTGPIFPLNFLA